MPDRLKEFLISQGCKSAVINLGGNVCCLGDKNGTPFNIGVRKPFGEATDTVAVFELNDMSLITSGVSERYFKGDDGRIYHHILDPSTGYPYDNGLYQVSVITKDSMDGDCLSTLALLWDLMKVWNSLKVYPIQRLSLSQTTVPFITHQGLKII